MGGVVPKTSDLRATGRLEQLAYSSNGGPQPLQKCHYRGGPHRGLTGLSTETGLLGTPVYERAG